MRGLHRGCRPEDDTDTDTDTDSELGTGTTGASVTATAPNGNQIQATNTARVDYPIMPGALRALCPVRRGVITGIRPYARYQFASDSLG